MMDRVRLHRIRPATRITLIYLVVAFTWILLSDALLGAMVTHPRLLSPLQTMKGWFFVAVTGAMLFVLLSRHFRAMEISRRELDEEHRRLNTLLGNLPGMAYRCADDPDWTMEFVSDGCLAITGYRPEVICGSKVATYANLVHPEDIDELRRVVREALDRGEQFRLYYRLRAADGVERWVWEQGRGVYDPQGRVVAIEGFITDVSALKRLEVESRTAQKLELVGRLAGGAAHDFNNLLTAISGYAALLRGRVGDDERSRRDITEIEGAVRRGSDLVRQLMTLSRPSPQRVELIDLGDLVTGMEGILLPLLGKGIRFSTQLAGEPVRIEGDRGQIEQVLMNLVVNAKDAMPDGGSLVVTVARSAGPSPRAGDPTRTPEAECVLEVTDTGEGMTEEVQAHLFEPFFTTKGEGKGSGLGLSTVDRIVSQHRGRVEVFSRVGQGTCFTVYFPCASRSTPC